ncbi:MAG: PfkB family carbohydrate kinase, partial [bacterium]
NALGVETILDAEGEPLSVGLKARPQAVTPNQLEAEEVVGHEFADRSEMVAGLDELISLGAREALITSERGCVASLGTEAGREVWEVSAPELDPVSTVGSGDALLAGFVARRYDGAAPEDCLRYAVACGAESTQHFGAGTVDAAEVERMVPSVEIQSVAAAPVT